jgi:hypothetical protein
MIRRAYFKRVPFVMRERIDLLINHESYLYKTCFRETGSIMIHIPKSAGTSVSRALYGRPVGHYKASDYLAISRKEFKKYFVFSIVRNPWDRVVSAYSFAKQGGTDYVQPLPNDIYKSPQFSDFKTFVMRWLAFQDLSKCDVVFQPQHIFVCDTDKHILVDYIGRYEALNDAIEYVSRQVNKSISIKALNKSERQTRYQDYYDDETKQMVARLYADDISIFSYSFD